MATIASPIIFYFIPILALTWGLIKINPESSKTDGKLFFLTGRYNSSRFDVTHTKKTTVHKDSNLHIY